MEQTNHKHKIPSVKKDEKKKCKECNKRRKTLDESHICHICRMIKSIMYKPSGNKVIDEFVTRTQICYVTRSSGKMEFVPYDQFKNIEFIAEGIILIVQLFSKKLNNSKNITIKELNELKEYT